MARIPKPENAIRELIELRTARGKTFDLGGNQRRLILGSGLAHYRDGNEWKDIDTTLVKERDEWKCETLPYRFRLHPDGIGFDFEDRDGGSVTNGLVAIGGQPLPKIVHPKVAGDTITFEEVATDLDIVFKVLPGQVKTLRILKSANAPRSFTWKVTHDERGARFVSDRLIGYDNFGATKRQERRELHLLLEKNGQTYTETWTGETKVRNFKTRQKSFSNAVTYPVEIDPTINREVNGDAYDGYEKNNGTGDWYDSYDFDALGYYSGLMAAYHSGWRFSGDSMPSGATVTVATLSLNITGKRHGAYAGGKIYGVDTVDFNPGWLTEVRMPTTVAKTSAFTTLSRPTTTGVVQYDVTGIIQELAAISGPASVSDIGLFALTTETTDRVTYFEDWHAAGTDHPKLDITYTTGGSPIVADVPPAALEFTGVAATSRKNAPAPIGLEKLLGIAPTARKSPPVPAVSVKLTPVAPTSQKGPVLAGVAGFRLSGVAAQEVRYVEPIASPHQTFVTFFTVAPSVNRTLVLGNDAVAFTGLPAVKIIEAIAPAVGVDLTAIAASTHKDAGAPAAGVDLLGVAMVETRPAPVAAVSCELTAVAMTSQHTANVAANTIDFTSGQPFNGMFAEPAAVTIELTGNVPTTSKSAPAPAAGMDLLGTLPSTHKDAPLPAAGLDVLGVAMVATRPYPIAAASLELGAPAPGSRHLAPLPAAAVELAGVTVVATRPQTIGVAAVEFAGGQMSLVAIANLPAAAVELSGVTADVTKTASAPAVSIEFTILEVACVRLFAPDACAAEFAAPAISMYLGANAPPAVIDITTSSVGAQFLAFVPSAAMELASATTSVSRRHGVLPALIELAVTMVQTSALAKHARGGTFIRSGAIGRLARGGAAGTLARGGAVGTFLRRIRP